jgi:CubicO group peptidase (beta-lactamase class C family)
MSTSKFAQFIRDYAEAHHFNGSIRVEIDGKLLFSGSFGIADRAFNVPCTEDTRYKIASITKAFTAVLVLQLLKNRTSILISRSSITYPVTTAKAQIR